MRKLWPSVVVLVAVTVFGVLRYDELPVQMTSQWDLAGKGYDWSSRKEAMYTVPLVALVTALLFALVPRIDPKRANFEQHASAFWLLANAVVGFFALIHLFFIGSNLGWPVSMQQVIGIGFGALLMVLGNYLTRIRQNWFLGIRTPWTLTSEKSWRETHRLGGKLFFAGGLLLLLVALITGRLPGWAIAVGIATPAVVSLIYSYVVWSRDPAMAAKGR